MKVFALLVAIFALLSSALALKDAVCGLPAMSVGNCRAIYFRYSYVAASNECVEFTYGGCHGNDNNFLSQAECEEKCKE